MTRAYRWISRKPHSVWELRNKLASYAGEQEIDEIINKLLELRLLDDFNFSVGYASYRLKERHLGPARIRKELRERGVAKETAESAIHLATQETSEEAAALAAVDKYFKKRPREKHVTDYRRILGHLLRAGFSPLVIHRILRQQGMDVIDWSSE